MTTWNAHYPYSFTLQHGSVSHVYRYPTFEQYLTDLLEFLARPVQGVNLIID